MSQEINTIIYPVKDAAGAKRLYSTLLGTEPFVDEPYYIGYQLNGMQVGLDPNGHSRNMTGPVCYVEVDDINASVEQLKSAGATVQQDATDVGGGKLIAMLTDADGNMIGVAQTTES